MLVNKLQNPNKHGLRYLRLMDKSKKAVLRVDPALVRVLAGEFAGSADFVTSMGPGDSFVMLYGCPSCQTGRCPFASATGFAESHRSTQTRTSTTAQAAQQGVSGRQDVASAGFCFTTVKMMILRRCDIVDEDMCKDYNVSMRRVLEAIGAIDKSTEDRISQHLTWEKKPCADPRKLEPVCKNIKLSVRCIGQEVHIGRKDPRSRSLTSTELVKRELRELSSITSKLCLHVTPDSLFP
eukprot:6476484-Amphidinium_carterae.1